MKLINDFVASIAHSKVIICHTFKSVDVEKILAHQTCDFSYIFPILFYASHFYIFTVYCTVVFF